MDPLKLLLVSTMWLILDVPAYINPLFRVALPSVEALSQLMALTDLVFCPGLLEVLQSAATPLISWFKNLPTNTPESSWGIYCVVLRKPGHVPLLYFGSGTGVSREGVKTRFGNYLGLHLSTLPTWVKAALNDGYLIVHLALLAHCPIPTVVLIPALRSFMICLEPAFPRVWWR
ncbi:hypothetical protein CKM354_000007400 [Cercospora kikuchii]|uniref:Uncharacterized protein n=1 Tax=Cercospora kikuchii TaxID=84275 RepID=A0A9P3C549_9PEZI|nr:uncharacterized protein CKM354_000007400 [Cercospora kikuchii]GIZ36604.1 hypothetical protein CKM354_000007400 [Cercospora kikuchii]